MPHARETTITFFVMYLSSLMSGEKPVHNAVRRFSCFPFILRLQPVQAREIWSWTNGLQFS